MEDQQVPHCGNTHTHTHIVILRSLQITLITQNRTFNIPIWQDALPGKIHSLRSKALAILRVDYNDVNNVQFLSQGDGFGHLDTKWGVNTNLSAWFAVGVFGVSEITNCSSSLTTSWCPACRARSRASLPWERTRKKTGWRYKRKETTCLYRNSVSIETDCVPRWLEHFPWGIYQCD